MLLDTRASEVDPMFLNTPQPRLLKPPELGRLFQHVGDWSSKPVFTVFRLAVRLPRIIRFFFSTFRFPSTHKLTEPSDLPGVLSFTWYSIAYHCLRLKVMLELTLPQSDPLGAPLKKRPRSRMSV